jgi:hypothetical protein
VGRRLKISVFSAWRSCRHGHAMAVARPSACGFGIAERPVAADCWDGALGRL